MKRPRILVSLATCAVAGVVVITSCDETPQSSAPTELVQPPVRASAAVTSATGDAVLAAAGNIAHCSRSGDTQTALLLDGIPGTVAALGDNANSTGSATEYTNCYDPTWGRHKARTRPAPGNIDYATADASGYFGYFGAAAGEVGKGYYSYDLGAWHVVVLNSNIDITAGSPQLQWLTDDLAASGASCKLAYWHHPRFFSYSGSPNAAIKPIWDVLYAAGVDVVLNAHMRNYERFAPQNPSGGLDTERGIRQFVVGTGGNDLSSFGTVRPNSEVRIASTYGVLKLTLGSGGYAWEFLPVGGGAALDTGTGTCHAAAPAGPPTADPGGPYTSDSGTVAFDGSASSDPGGNLPLTYAWNFGDGATGTGAKPSHTYAATGTYTVKLTVTNSLGTSSAPASTTATVTVPSTGPSPAAAVVDEMTFAQLYPSNRVKIRALARDSAGSPWSYTVAWGDGTTSTGSVTSLSTPVVAAHDYPGLGAYAVAFTIRDAGGAATTANLAVKVRDGSNAMVFSGAGDISKCSNNRDELTARILDTLPGSVFTLGDNVYDTGTTAEYANCYQPTWGRHLSRTYASIGNHEYDTAGAIPTYDYFGDHVGPRNLGYYSFDLGAWHVVVLNDNSKAVPYKSGSVQDTWLRDDLAKNSKRCVIGIWHQPRFFSGQTTTTPSAARKIFWDRLYAVGAELVLNGHMHHYERFAPMRPDGTRDDVNGIRSIIAGTGGSSTATPTVAAPNSIVRAGGFGVLKLTLNSDSYTWEFIPLSGYNIVDFGTGECR